MPAVSAVLLASVNSMNSVKSAEPRYYAKFYRNRSNRGRDTTFFGFLQIAAAVILDYKILKFLTVGHAKKVELCHLAKFRRNRLNCSRDMVIFSIFQDGGGRHLGFSKFPLTVGTVKKFELHQCAEFRRNRSKRGRDM